MKIELCDNISEWNDYVNRSDKATLYHLFEWRSIIENTFGHKPYYLMAKDKEGVKGVLPLFLISSRVFGVFMVSLPFHCIGGICADNEEDEKALLTEAIRLTKEKQGEYLELRQFKKVEFEGMRSRENKVTFILKLDDDPDVVWKDGFCSNLRNKVRKAQKFDLKIESGIKHEYVDKFYSIFSRNMKDLGTPVQSRKFFENIIKEFPEQTKIFVAGKDGKTIGVKFAMYFRDTVYFIWASSLRDHFNMASASLLNWEVIKEACHEGYKYCDFGRSTINDGTYKFKEQFGAEPKQLYWQYFLNTKTEIPDLNRNNSKYKTAIEIWKRMPLFMANFIGPKIVKYIP